MSSYHLQCSSCQRAILRTFVAALRPTVRIAPLHHRPRASQHQSRTFRNVTVLKANDSQAKKHDLSSPRGLDVEAVEDAEPLNLKDLETTPTPWYLQDTPLQPEPSPMAERQRLPDLPTDAPAMLEPLLTHLSIDLGLDYLSLMDLRDLDPPAALGANLLMIFGSARSEKHLHVSADRLCRWLRSNHRLTPYADGLLGRNELKLKLKRKARRSKLLGSNAHSQMENLDDGIRTGWICVNVGVVENTECSDPPTTRLPKPGFVGFGGESDGVRIVVQMMTDEKRGDVDLEALWTGMLNRQARREEKQIGEQESISADISVSDPGRFPVSSSAADRMPVSGRSTGAGTHVVGQARAFHTAVRARSVGENTTPNDNQEPNEFEVEPRFQRVLTSTSEDAKEGQTPRRNLQHGPTTESGAKFEISSNDLSIRTQLNYLAGLSNPAAQEVLGEGEDDKSSTSFLASFYQEIPVLPQFHHWECIIDLHCAALAAGHPGYSQRGLMNKLSEAEKSGTQLSKRVYWECVKAILYSVHVPDGWNEFHASKLNLSLSLDILEEMESLGYQILTDELFLLLHQAISSRKISSASAFEQETSAQHRTISPELTREQKRKLLNHLRQIMARLQWTPTSNQFFITVLNSYADQDLWHGFWDTWNDIARALRPRPPELYELLFRRVAQTGDQLRCQRVLETQIPEMSRERPVVKIEGDLAAAVRMCQAVAGTTSFEHAQQPEANSECDRVSTGGGLSL